MHQSFVYAAPSGPGNSGVKFSIFKALLKALHCGAKSAVKQFPVLCSRQNIRKFSETTGPTETKFHVAPPWDKGKDGKLIQII